MITEAIMALAEVERTKRAALDAAAMRLPEDKARAKLEEYVDAEEALFATLREVFPGKFEGEE